MTFSSATGCTKACSGRVSTAFASATGVAGLISIGRARRCGLRTMSMHTLLAMRYSQERSDDRPSKRSIARQARIIVSLDGVSASDPEPSMR